MQARVAGREDQMHRQAFTSSLLNLHWPKNCSPPEKSSTRQRRFDGRYKPLPDQEALLLDTGGTTEMKKHSLKITPLSVPRCREWFLSVSSWSPPFSLPHLIHFVSATIATK